MGFKYRVWTKKEEQIVLDNHGKITNREIGKMVGKTEKQVGSKVSHLRDKGLIERVGRQDLLPEIEAEVGSGLNLKSKSLKFEIGTEYIIFTSRRSDSKLNKSFKGVFIQDTPRHLNFRSRHGYCESFLKVDFLIGTHEAKKIYKEGDR